MQALSDLFKCPNNYCDSNYLMVIQWASQAVSKGGGTNIVPPHDSVVQLNNTVFGYPEFSYFHKNVFLKDIDSSKEYQTVTVIIF